MKDIREITGVYRITGSYNLIVKVLCSNINELNLLIKRLHQLGVRKTVTNIVLEKFVDEGIEFTEDFLIR